MIRYGAPAHAMRPTTTTEVFLGRLKLLIIMAKAFLKGYPMGDFRIQAMAQNARFVFYEVLKLSSPQPEAAADQESSVPSPPTRPLDYLLLQRAQLLSIMCTSIADGHPLGDFRQQALQENIESICTYLSEQPLLSNMPFLKVACGALSYPTSI
jgi:hypothetical protein